MQKKHNHRHFVFEFVIFCIKIQLRVNLQCRRNNKSENRNFIKLERKESKINTKNFGWKCSQFQK